MSRRVVSCLVSVGLVGVVTLIAPSTAVAASRSGSGITCQSSTGYIVQIRSTSKGLVVHESQTPYTYRSLGYRSSYTYGSTSTGTSKIGMYEAKGTDYAGTAGGVQSASVGCGTS